jgi:hypothetical protein
MRTALALCFESWLVFGVLNAGGLVKDGFVLIGWIIFLVLTSGVLLAHVIRFVVLRTDQKTTTR